MKDFLPLGNPNGNPLQYSCLENPMDGRAWWATVHRVAKSRTRLSDLTNWLSTLSTPLHISSHQLLKTVLQPRVSLDSFSRYENGDPEREGALTKGTQLVRGTTRAQLLRTLALVANQLSCKGLGLSQSVLSATPRSLCHDLCYIKDKTETWAW